MKLTDLFGLSRPFGESEQLASFSALLSGAASINNCHHMSIVRTLRTRKRTESPKARKNLFLTDWVQSIVYEQGVTKSSRKTYASHMRRFFRWLEDEGGYTGAPLEAFSVPVLRRFTPSCFRLFFPSARRAVSPLAPRG
jgi:site-specific recombinase XerD